MTTETPAAGLTIRPAAGTNRRSLDWMDDALCAQIDPDLWFPTNGHPETGKQICNTCPARTHCGQHIEFLEADAPGQARHGTWAGQSSTARADGSLLRGHPTRDARILRLAALGWDAPRIADTVGCTDRTVYRITARAKEAS